MIIRPTTKLIASLTMTMEAGLQMPTYSYTGLSKLRLGEDLGTYVEQIPNQTYGAGHTVRHCYSK